MIQGSTATAPTQGATPVVAAAPTFSPDEELVLEVRTPDWILTDGMIGYSTPRGVYLPLGDFTRLLELAISLEGETRAEGWFLSERRTFRLDLPTGELEVEGRQSRLQPGDAIAYDGEIYVRAPLLAEWFPIGISVSQAQLQVRVETKEAFPFESRAARDAKRGMIGIGADRVTYPRERTPYRVFTTPGVDVLTSATFDTEGQTSTAGYDLRASGDLLFMSADLFANGNNDEALSALRFALSRRDPDGRILGPLGLSDIQLGDTFSAGLPFGVRSQAGRGVFFSSAPLDNPSVFDRLDLRGELPLGYEVELYRNDVLIGSQNRPVDGRYEFLDVPLEFGRNVLRLIFYGPRGERREEVRQIQVGGGRLPGGEFRFTGGLIQQDTNLFNIGEEREGEGPGSGGGGQPTPGQGEWRGTLYGEYGVNTLLTVAGGLASFTVGDRRREQLSGGVRTALADAVFQLDAAVQDAGAWAVQGGLAGRKFGVSYVLQHSEYQGDFTDELRGGGQSLQRATSGRFDWSNQLGGGKRTIASSVVTERVEDALGNIQTTGALRNSTSFSAWLVSNVLDFTRSVRGDEASRSIRGALEVNGGIGEYNVRAGLSYDVDPDPSLQDLNFTVDRRYGEDLLVRVGVLQQLSRERTTRVAASVAKQFRRFDVSVDAQYDTESKNVLFGVRMGFSLGRDPFGRFVMDRPGLARGGSVLASAFRDLDGDGVRDPKEPPLPGLEFRSGGREARTDKAGNALLSGIGDGRPTSVSLNAASLDDPYLTPSRAGLEVVPRPGRTHLATFPIVSVSEIEGDALFAGAGEAKPVSNVALQLVDAGGEVVASAKTEYDGYFLFEKVRPGRFLVRLDPEQAARLSIRVEGEPTVETSPEGGLVDGLKVRIVRVAKPAES